MYFPKFSAPFLLKNHLFIFLGKKRFVFPFSYHLNLYLLSDLHWLLLSHLKTFSHLQNLIFSPFLLSGSPTRAKQANLPGCIYPTTASLRYSIICQETKSKHIDWTQSRKWDPQFLPWAWPWPWSFKVKYWICYISGRHCLIGTKWKTNTPMEH